MKSKKPFQQKKTAQWHSICFLIISFQLAIATVASASHLLPTPAERGADPIFKDQAALQYAHLDEAMNLLLDEKTQLAENILIGVIDKGTVNRQHPDLLDVLLPESDINSSSPGETHGQYVTGILAARAYNDVGIRGAIGIKARVIYRQVRSVDDIIYSINKLVARGVAVINMSLGLDAPCATLHIDQEKCQEPIALNSRVATAIQTALRGSNTVVVISAGNDHQLISPFATEKDGLIIVGAMNEQGRVAGYSNYGPGVSIYAPDFGVWGLTSKGYVSRQPATSFTTPLVSAAAAWAALYLRAHNVKYTARDIKSLILTSARPQPKLTDKSEVPGSLDYLNLARALQTFVQHTHEPPTRKAKIPTKR